MKRITFLPRHLAQAHEPGPSAALISFRDPDLSPLSPRPGWRDALFIACHDADAPGEGLVIFSAEQARACVDFAMRHQGLDELVINCELGQSRSAGVALALSELLGAPCFKQGLPVSAQSYTVYNRKLYSMLMEAAHGPVGSAFLALPEEPEPQSGREAPSARPAPKA